MYVILGSFIDTVQTRSRSGTHVYVSPDVSQCHNTQTNDWPDPLWYTLGLLKYGVLFKINNIACGVAWMAGPGKG